MLLFTNGDMRNLLARSSLKTATLDQNGWRDSGEGPGSTEGNYINWLTFLLLAGSADAPRAAAAGPALRLWRPNDGIAPLASFVQYQEAFDQAESRRHTWQAAYPKLA